MVPKPLVICLTPVRNEAWILDVFLKCTSLWADRIIIADQQSTDGSREIASRYPKVILIDNLSSDYNEVARQKILLTEARKIKGKRLLITLDADELFTSSYSKTNEWQQMLDASEGSVFGFRWINLCPGFKKCWITDGYFPWAYMDDGAEHVGLEMHSSRVPIKDWAKIVPMQQIKVLHYQYTDWARMESKHRYYQCLERIKYPHKHAIEIFRMYHHMYAIPEEKKIVSREEWFRAYEKKCIPVRSLPVGGGEHFWFDQEVMQKIEAQGASYFRRESIWDVDWCEKARKSKCVQSEQFKDPRSFIDKLVQAYLKETLKILHTRLVKILDLLVRTFLWRQ
ncbi:MAG: glycosyltransferase family 2 protein [Candidatus Omnitrophica bacterium]|nr:glycosyltransferase family 2 protein [Candidatus Omnitrophota bacterium]